MPKPIQHFITLGDTFRPIKARLVNEDGDYTRARDVNGLTLGFHMIDSSGATVIDSDTSNTAIATAQAFTVDTTTDELIDTDHGLVVNDEVILTTTGTLPAGLATSTTYYVMEKSQHRFQLSTEQGGSAIDITDTGSGTHSYRALGHVQYDFQDAGVDTAGEYTAWFVVTESTETEHYPSDQDRTNPTFQVVVKSNA